jgi:hypothetical protein
LGHREWSNSAVNRILLRFEPAQDHRADRGTVYKPGPLDRTRRIVRVARRPEAQLRRHDIEPERESVEQPEKLAQGLLPTLDGHVARGDRLL